MTFDRAASVTVVASLGYSESSDLGPTTGNGFDTRWPDDLAAVAALGLTAVRLPLDWARLQPRPGVIDGDWAEWTDDVLAAVRSLGVQAWVVLHEGAIPRWFDNEGGLDDVETLTRWWPRWVERAAERFGDRVDGWVPFATLPPNALLRPWEDTWGILGGASAPVVASLDVRPAARSGFRYVEQFAGLTDRVGLDLTDLVAEVRADVMGSADSHGGGLDELGERIREAISRAVHDVTERVGSTPLTVTALPTGRTDSEAATIVEVAMAMLGEAVDDGIRIEQVFVEPAIGASDGPVGLLDPDRAPTDVATAFQVRPR